VIEAACNRKDWIPARGHLTPVLSAASFFCSQVKFFLSLYSESILNIPVAANEKIPSHVRPMLATLVDEPFHESRWL
jgi:hypothetical protein